MNSKIALFFVSVLLAVFSSGCAISHSQGMFTTSSILGTNVSFGYTERTDVAVRNSYSNLTMEVTLQEIIVPHTAQRGMWVDPILGTPIRPGYGARSKTVTSMSPGQGLTVPLHCIITNGNYLAVFVSWYDENGQCRGESSDTILVSSSPECIQHYGIWPYMGRFGTVLGRVIQKP